MSEYITPDEARALLERADRRRAKLRAEHPAAAHVFPPVSDEIWRYVIEQALLGELRRTPLLPPLRTRGAAITRRRPPVESAETARPAR